MCFRSQVNVAEGALGGAHDIAHGNSLSSGVAGVDGEVESGVLGRWHVEEGVGSGESEGTSDGIKSLPGRVLDIT